MPRYYCPYCFDKKATIFLENQDDYFCSICGEKLERKPSIRITQIISLLIVLGLVSPLSLFLLSAIKDNNKNVPVKKNYDLTLALPYAMVV